MVRVFSIPLPARFRPALETQPRVLAEFSTEPTDARRTDKRWTHLRLTELSPGRYLCEKTRGPEPVETRNAEVGNLESAKAFFGGGWVVKELFAELDRAKSPRRS